MTTTHSRWKSFKFLHSLILFVHGQESWTQLTLIQVWIKESSTDFSLRYKHVNKHSCKLLICLCSCLNSFLLFFAAFFPRPATEKVNLQQQICFENVVSQKSPYVTVPEHLTHWNPPIWTLVCLQELCSYFQLNSLLLISCTIINILLYLQKTKCQVRECIKAKHLNFILVTFDNYPICSVLFILP